MTTIPDGIAVLGLVVPAGTGLVGYVLAGRNEQARDERAAKREATARRASVRERLVEQSHAFQRETLLELQDALQRQVRSVAKMILHDKRTLEEQGTLTLLGEELDAESYEIGVTVRRLQERVLNATLRRTVDEFRGHVTHVETSFFTVHERAPRTAFNTLTACNATWCSTTPLSATSLARRYGRSWGGCPRRRSRVQDDRITPDKGVCTRCAAGATDSLSPA